MGDASNIPANRSRGRGLALSGLALAILGVVAFAVQMSRQRLMLPWYMPALALLGLVLLVVSLCKRPTVWRGIALGLVALLLGLEVVFLYGTRLPAYAGPIAVGHPFPTFEARRADGTSFTQSDLIGEQNHILVFFRGRW